MNDDLKKSLNKKNPAPIFEATKLTNDQGQEQISPNDNITNVLSEDAQEQVKEKSDHKKKDKPLKVFGGICLAVFVAAMIFSFKPAVDTSDAAKQALSDRVSTSVAAGTILRNNDEKIEPQDYIINHSYDKSESKILVWDFAAEDGDYVQVLVNGSPVSEAFMIKHKPVEMTVPAVGEVQIKGIRDGGGGITYAVRYELNGTCYFNLAPEGEFNTYTLIKE